MKHSAKIATLAVALFAGFAGTAMANGTETPAPPQEPAAAAPSAAAPVREPYMPPMAAPAKERSTSGPYISGSGGVAISGRDNVKTGYNFTGAVGYNFDPARIEAAVGYQRHDLRNISGNIDYWTFMANAYYDYDADLGFKPYLMGGLGAARSHFSPTGHNKTEFAWQVGTGVGFKIGDGTTLDIGYRFVRPDTDDINFNSHNIMAGIRYQF